MKADKTFPAVFTKITKVTKATCSLKAPGVGLEELAWVNGRAGQVVRIEGEEATLQVFGGTNGIGTDAEVVFFGAAPSLLVGPSLSGRFLDAYGKPIDGGPELEGESREVGGPSAV